MFATPHEWRVWQDIKLPDGKILIPGVVSHATNVVEHPELVADRILTSGSVLADELLHRPSAREAGMDRDARAPARPPFGTPQARPKAASGAGPRGKRSCCENRVNCHDIPHDSYDRSIATMRLVTRAT